MNNFNRIITTASLVIATAACNSEQKNTTITTVDSDSNGLIEISTIGDLDLIRGSLDGSSIDGNTEGCPSDGCIGFELTSDLDFDTNGDGKITELDEYWNNGKGWESIGSVDNPFTGVFEGNGHEIRNLYINGGSDIALFGVSEGAQFTNIALKSFNIFGGLEESRAGSLVSYAQNTTINDCSASGSVSGSRAIGGLVSVINEGRISNCTLDVMVNSTGWTAGGLAALALNSEIEHITVSGSIQSDGHTVGGVIAMALEKSQLSYLSYRGTVKGSASVGGITGAIEWSGLSNSYAYAEVSATEDSVGGLVGSIEDQSVTYQSQAACSISGQSDVGGLVGYSNKGKIWNVTFTGDVTAEQNAGQLVGTMRGGQYNYTVTTGWPIESPSSVDYTSVGGLVGLDYSNVNFDSGKSLLELANESARADWERMNSDNPLENYIGLTLDSQKRIYPDMDKWTLTPEELSCPTAPNDHECWPGDVLYTGWDPSIWNFGNQQQLPKLKGMPDPSCKHLDQ